MAEAAIMGPRAACDVKIDGKRGDVCGRGQGRNPRRFN
jgi:hypothetical protein